ncbi:MAG: hypothetical protein ABR540_05480 [Acidimicrobiales bacterium]
MEADAEALPPLLTPEERRLLDEADERRKRVMVRLGYLPATWPEMKAELKKQEELDRSDGNNNDEVSSSPPPAAVGLWRGRPRRSQR